ncbi:MAG: hypothetical protein ABIE03_07470 [Patescibacteria group bacterium]|nr:hypothetical protein [Patescibacteria group bacterium]
MVFLYSFLTSIFFTGLFFYLINFALMPYDADNNLNIRNFAIVTVMFIPVVASIFSLVHLIFDKLFFRKFYEGPKVYVGIRRGVLLGILLSGLAWVRVFGYWEWHILLVIISLVFLFELLFISISMGQSRKEGKENENGTESLGNAKYENTKRE